VPSVSTGLLVLLALWAFSSKKKPQKPRPPFVRWTDGEMLSFMAALDRVPIDVGIALKVYAAESGLNPKASSGVAWGLCQAIESTLRSAGWNGPAKGFGLLGVAEQAPWVADVIRQQIKMIGFTPDNALDLFVANLSPLAAKQHADVIYRAPSQNYEANKNLDREGKGYINRADMNRRLNEAASSPAYQTAVAQWQSLRAKARSMANGLSVD
jgi:hypothetical protein